MSSLGEPSKCSGSKKNAQETITVYIPDKQVLTPEALRELARTRSLEQWLDYDVEGKTDANYA